MSIGHDLAEIGWWINDSVSDVYHDVIGIGKELASTPKSVINTTGSVANNLVDKTADTIKTVVPDITDTITKTTSNIFQGPIIWVVGIGAALIFGPKLLKNFNT